MGWIVVGVLIAGSDGLRCMQCSKAPHFAHCEEIVTCNSTQLCYVEEQIVYGQTLIFAGCKNKTDCDSMGCFGEEKLRRKRDTASETRLHGGKELKCHHCCDSDFCNMYGCPDKLNVTHLTGSRCFTCEAIGRPELCDRIKNCESQNVCFMQKYAFEDQVRYTLGCKRKAMCDLLATRHLQERRKRQVVPFYSECCSSHLCNRHEPMDKHPPSPYSVNYRCPAPPPTTTRVTQTTTTTPTTTTPSTTVTTTTAQTTTERLKTKIVPIVGTSCHDQAICILYSKETACSLQWRGWARETCPVMCGLCGTTTESTTQVSVTSSSCKDLLDCTVYGRDYACKGEYIPWAQINCPAYCGFCGDSKATTVAGSASVTACEDKEDCSKYGKDYACVEEFKEWATVNCPKFCGLCDVNQGQHTTPAVFRQVTGTTDCVDKEDCSVYGRDYICTAEFSTWARIQCPAYCGLCTGVIASSTATVATMETSTQKHTDSMTDCVDKEDCSIYGRDYACTAEFSKWARIQCPAYCGLCTGTLTSSTSTVVTMEMSTKTQNKNSTTGCVDKEDCSIYGRDYACSKEYATWAKYQCPSYCGLCSDCSDKEDCSVYGFEYICTPEYRSWAEQQCPAFCGYC